MQRRRVSLFEFMPYGAPELIEAFPTFLSRAVFSGALLWSVAFVLLVSSGLMRVDRDPIAIPIPPVFDLADVNILPLESKAQAEPVTKRPPHSEFARFDPAKIPVEPATEPVTGEPDGAEVAPAGTVSSEPGNQAGIPTVSVTPLPDMTYEQYEVEKLPETSITPRPVYPSLAREAQVEGRVVLRARVDRDGRVTDIEVVQSILLLDEAAVDAARKWRFTPARVGGRAVAVWVLIPFHFRLH